MSRTLTLVIGALIMLAMATLVLVALPHRELQAEVPPAQLKPYTLAEPRGRATCVDKFFRAVLIAPVIGFVSDFEKNGTLHQRSH
jgi:cbb3-type cytochrome oxidase cytochrome c subunit